MRIVFVILHYENLDDTKECLESLGKYLNNNDVFVVVVDNGSQNRKLSSISADYENDKVQFLYSADNLGFAKGNNIGYLYAKYQLNADIIILANNDLVFSQTDFIEKLVKEYDIRKFDVAGPQIISLVDGKNQNPVAVQFKNCRDLNRRIFRYLILYMLCMLNLDLIAQSIFAKDIEEFHPNEDDDIQLHGACMIFAREYINKFDGLYDKTFMYCEEGILKFIVKRENMRMMYLENLKVNHKEGASTKTIYGKGRKKRLFYYKWNLESCRILKKLMKEDKICWE
jgi:GT2 family glycosyltransferase